MRNSIRPTILVIASLAVACTGTAPAPIQSPTPTATSVPISTPTSARATATPTAVPATATPAVTAAPTASARPATPTAAVAECRHQDPLTVYSSANIFGAGFARPPEPAGGGAGSPPTLVDLPVGSSPLVTFPCVTGLVTPIDGVAPLNGPDGDLGQNGTTDVTSYQGISGIVHRRKGMFLVGVFLTDEQPSEPAPERLDFTDSEDFETLAPEIAQTFFIGDGVGRTFVAPAGATRLFLGFADSALYQGAPGWYGNNFGQLEVTVQVATP